MQVITERRKVKFSDKKHGGKTSFEDIMHERHMQSLPEYEVLPPHKSYFDLGVQSVAAYENSRNRMFNEQAGRSRLREIEFEVESEEEEVYETEVCGVGDAARTKRSANGGGRAYEHATGAGERMEYAEYADRTNTDADAELDYSRIDSERRLPSEETMKQRLSYEGSYQDTVEYYERLLDGRAAYQTEVAPNAPTPYAPVASASSADRYEREQRRARGEIQGHISLNAQSKIAVAAYIALILTMLIVALITASSIAALSGREAALENELAASQAELSLLDDQSLTLGEDASVYAKASELGMYAPYTGAGLRIVSVPSMKTQNEYPIKSNWFNSFCAWLSNLFGG
jgi:hypothetical protein